MYSITTTLEKKMFMPTDWSPVWIAFYVVFGVFAVFLGFLDYFELLAMRYSKFGTKQGIPSRTAMFILYFLPIPTSIIVSWYYIPTAGLAQWLVLGVVLTHFVKRTLEVLFLHKYSGNMQILTFGVIVGAYSLMAGMISWLNGQQTASLNAVFYAGLALYAVGELGNFYHHKLLAGLRKNDSGYHIPKGGWFEYATCPHYFFELLAWLGIFLVSQHFFTLLTFIAMVGYLTGRSIKTRQWYKERFKKKYPANRKYMIPYIF
jgi:steroid 5-alpha reductase family enzyme